MNDMNYIATSHNDGSESHTWESASFRFKLEISHEFPDGERLYSLIVIAPEHMADNLPSGWEFNESLGKFWRKGDLFSTEENALYDAHKAIEGVLGKANYLPHDWQDPFVSNWNMLLDNPEDSDPNRMNHKVTKHANGNESHTWESAEFIFELEMTDNIYPDTRMYILVVKAPAGLETGWKRNDNLADSPAFKDWAGDLWYKDGMFTPDEFEEYILFEAHEAIAGVLGVDYPVDEWKDPFVSDWEMLLRDDDHDQWHGLGEL